MLLFLCDSDFRVFNLMGNQATNWSDESRIEVANWPAGTYIVQSRTGETASIMVSH